MEQHHLNILLVEDQAAEARLVQEYLGMGDRIRSSVQWAQTLFEALGQLEEQEFDVVLLDLGLPDSVGIDTFTAVARRYPDLPVVVLTGVVEDSVALEALRGGAQDFLLKGDLSSGLLTRTVLHAVERHALREDVRRSTRSLRTLLEASRDGILVLDTLGRVQYLNPAAERLIGRRQAEMLGELLHLPISGQSGVEVRLDRPDGSYATAELQITRTEWDGHAALLIFMRDVTVEREGVAAQAALAVKTTALEETEKLMEERARFINLVTHELRTPMTAISSGVQVLMTGGLGEVNPKQQRFLEMIQRNTERLVRFSSDVLSLSRLEGGTYPIRSRPVPLAASLAPVLAALASSARDNGVILQVAKEQGDLVLVLADPDALSQVVTNLVSNAIVHCPAGTTVNMSWRELPSGARVEVLIADNGPGIPEHDQDLLFRPSYQANPARRTETVGAFYKGTGLGLSICKLLVEGMDGEISVATGVGEGTSFRISLPAG